MERVGYFLKGRNICIVNYPGQDDDPKKEMRKPALDGVKKQLSPFLKLILASTLDSNAGARGREVTYVVWSELGAKQGAGSMNDPEDCLCYNLHIAICSNNSMYVSTLLPLALNPQYNLVRSYGFASVVSKEFLRSGLSPA